MLDRIADEKYFCKQKNWHPDDDCPGDPPSWLDIHDVVPDDAEPCEPRWQDGPPPGPRRLKCIQGWICKLCGPLGLWLEPGELARLSRERDVGAAIKLTFAVWVQFKGCPFLPYDRRDDALAYRADLKRQRDRKSKAAKKAEWEQWRSSLTKAELRSSTVIRALKKAGGELPRAELIKRLRRSPAFPPVTARNQKEREKRADVHGKTVRRTLDDLAKIGTIEIVKSSPVMVRLGKMSPANATKNVRILSGHAMSG